MKQKKRIKKWIYRVIMMIALSVFLYSAYQLGTIFYANYQEKNETSELRKNVKTIKQQGKEVPFEVNFDALKKVNPDIVAWIYIPDTEISYAVVQGSDNEYYLHHTAAKEYNYAGAIFLDAAADPDFQDYNSFIYGHTMNHGTMFTDIKKYKDIAFASTHKEIYLFTPTKKYKCPVYAMYSTIDTSDSYRLGHTNELTQNSYLEMIKGLSEYDYGVEANENEKLITLSTCSFEDGTVSNKRYLLHALLREWSEADEIKK